MDATTILERLSGIGITVTLSGDRIRLEPGSSVPPELVKQVKAHKQELIPLLKGYRLKYANAQATGEELEEIQRKVHSEGYVLLWCRILHDLIAFYRDEESRNKILPGFVAYSEAELQDLFGKDKPHVPTSTLILIHEAKKHGARVINYQPNNSCDEVSDETL